MLTQEFLKSILHYNPETGVFTWKERTNTRKEWNTRYSGTIAGNIRKNGIIAISINNKNYLAHRLVWLYVYGTLPDNLLDHKNTNPSDNRISNLRTATTAQNLQNQIKPSKNNLCGYLGVCYDKQSKKFRASITINYKSKSIGLFDTPEEAHQAYLKAKKELHPFSTI